MRKTLYRILDTRAGLKWNYEKAYERGYAEGEREAEGKGCYCPHHRGESLVESSPGHFDCPLCLYYQREQQQPQERTTTGGMVRITDPYQQPGQLMKANRKEKLPEWKTEHEPVVRFPGRGQ